MRALKEPLVNSAIWQSILADQKKKKYPIMLSGCQDAQKSHLIAGLAKDKASKLILTYREEAARELYENLNFFEENVVLYPSKDILFYNADVHSNQVVKKRMEILERLSQKEPITIVACFDVLMEKLIPFSALEERIFTIEQTSIIDTKALRLRLVEMGYEANGLVEKPGDFSIRGDIIDIYPLTAIVPVRIELWGDEIDSIRTFNADSQRSIENIESVTIFPATEMILPSKNQGEALKKINAEFEEQRDVLKAAKMKESVKRLSRIVSQMMEEIRNFGHSTNGESLMAYYYEETESLLDYLPKDVQIFIDDPYRVEMKGQGYETEFSLSMVNRLNGGYILPGQANIIYGYKQTLAKLSNREVYFMNSSLNMPQDFVSASTYEVQARSIPSYNNSFEQLLVDLEKWSKKSYQIILMSSSGTRAKRLADDIQERGFRAYYAKDYDRSVMPGEVMVVQGHLSNGFEYPELKFVVLTEKDIFKEKKQTKKQKKSTHGYQGKKITSLNDISLGDYVVHEKYGLGIYRGMEQIESDGVAKDYINIEYKDNSNLFIPASQLEIIQKYAGGGSHAPKLNKLGGSEWEKTKSKVRKQVEIAAKDLITLYAKRQGGEGYAFTEDTVWQKEFEELFPYEETEDQLLAIEETKKDMESKKIMDRLICGDVGYGKTEVAIRAAFKAVMDSKQVAFLVPTTILAQQHFNNFKERMSHYPIEIRMLSRFCTAKEQKEIKAGLKSGKIDIVIGTHKLLSKTLEYHDLGLLIIDEEQRFGVRQKEKIKELKKDIDVIALSATPIPRTLHMSMAGIRDMSLLQIPPVDRRSVQTYVLEYNEELIREAIERELARNGQVYYVYNRVNDIEQVAEKIREIVPDARIEFAHGRMNEHQLEDIMMRFIGGEIDVLVSTTIIETGLDIPNANTMIIHNAQMFGLSQLYQLRGRVGRSKRTAYAFLMYQRDRQLKEVAEERLKAIREFTDLGSGFKIAMRDLEIRGAGNLLGAAQSGHIDAVGYELYCKMLNDAMEAMRGEKDIEEIFHTSIDLNIDAYIPSDYVENESQKLAIYKRIMLIDSREEAEDMQEELTDRYGDVPSAVLRLIEVVLLRAKAHDAWITTIEQKGQFVHFTIHEKAKIKVEEVDNFLKSYRRKMRLSPNAPVFIFDTEKVLKKDMLSTIKNVVEKIAQLMEK